MQRVTHFEAPLTFDQHAAWRLIHCRLRGLPKHIFLYVYSAAGRLTESYSVIRSLQHEIGVSCASMSTLLFVLESSIYEIKVSYLS